MSKYRQDNKCKNQYNKCKRNIMCKRVVHCTPTVFLICPNAQTVTTNERASTTTTTSPPHPLSPKLSINFSKNFGLERIKILFAISFLEKVP
ncbi:5514_t:CDS:2 [Funneliformis caledonium]|uniref:5514_t:CDS:1 n=1 Tax=Funneliformis caledonium TaxID=1117310 RepID=A0A9N9AHG1_9GLOM|nr:5514_t:CDS:2 [Funneliformis caledonium]